MKRRKKRFDSFQKKRKNVSKEKKVESKIFEVYRESGRLYTQNLTPGKTLFTEKIVNKNGKELREWDPSRSKLAAAIVKGCTNTFLRKGSLVLYLGAAHGYTPSFISDIVGKEGFIFALDHSPRVVRDLVFLSKVRENIVPLLASARTPQDYVDKVCQVDIVYQDIAQRDQAEIFIKNVELFLKKGGYGLLAIKARSIDITKKPKQIFEEMRRKLDKTYAVIDYRILYPFEKDHCFIIVKKK